MANSDNNSQNFYSDDPVVLDNGPKKRKLPTLLVLLLLIVSGSYAIQTTLAANISLNNGARVEFGQGNLRTAACSGETVLTITPHATFTNAHSSGSYKFNSVTVSEVPDSCFGVDFLIKAYNNTDGTPLSLFNTDSTTAVIYDNAGTFEVGTGGTGTSITSGSGSFTITFDTPVALSSTVFKLTIESGIHTSRTYSAGETGAGGGKVFYVSSTPFPCGATLSSMCTSLEAAPWNWNATRDIDTAWCSSGTSSNTTVLGGTHPTSSAIGVGLKNTIAIAASCTGGAANIARAYRGGGFDDWHLPDIGEYLEMYARYSTLGIEGSNYYNLSDESDAGAGFVGMLGFNGNASLSGKSVAYRVRPIRAF